MSIPNLVPANSEESSFCGLLIDAMQADPSGAVESDLLPTNRRKTNYPAIFEKLRSDLDIAVARADVAQTVRVLQDLGVQSGWNTITRADALGAAAGPDVLIDCASQVADFVRGWSRAALHDVSHPKDATKRVPTRVLSRNQTRVTAAAEAVKPKLEPWPRLRSFDASAQPVPCFGLPTAMRDMVDAVGTKHEVPSDMTVTTALTIAAAAIQNSVYVHITDDWDEPLAVQSLVLAESGGRKSQVVSELAKPLRERDGKRQRSDASRAAKRAQQLDAEKKELSQARTAFTKARNDGEHKGSADAASVKGSPGIAEEGRVARHEDRVLALSRPALKRRAIYDDVTVEKLARELSESYTSGVSLISDESKVFDNITGLYNSGASNMTVLLCAFSGGTISTDRVGGGSSYAENPASCATLTTQPSHFADLLAKHPEMLDYGLIPRMLITNVPYTPRTAVRAVPVPVSVRDEWSKAIGGLCDAVDEHVDLGNPGSTAECVVPARMIRLSAEADAALHDGFVTELRDHEESGYVPDHIKSWYSKATAAVAKLAAVMELFTDPSASEVRAEYVECAADIVWAVSGHVDSITVRDRGTRDAETLLTKLRKLADDDGQISNREMQRAASFRSTDRPGKDRLESALAELDERGYVQVLEGQKSSHGPASRTIHLRPSDT